MALFAFHNLHPNRHGFRGCKGQGGGGGSESGAAVHLWILKEKIASLFENQFVHSCQRHNIELFIVAVFFL